MKYSFFVPIYNDGALANDFVRAYEKVFLDWLGNEKIENEVELIFVNDGSKNDSIENLVHLSKKYPFVRVIDLSRNFGQHISLSCGYLHAKGEFVGMLNVDMEDSPAEIPK